jgi:hypothetical protein
MSACFGRSSRRDRCYADGVRHRARGGPGRTCHSEYKYLLTFEAGIDTAITKHLSLRVLFQDMYASRPAPSKKQNDMRLLAGASYRF